jgi:hypothetical protein
MHRRPRYPLILLDALGAGPVFAAIGFKWVGFVLLLLWVLLIFDI